MAIDQKTVEPKEFLDRADIVTMKKDIKRLREADAFKESAKITSAPVTNQRPQSSPTLQETSIATPPRPNLNFVKKVPVTPVKEPAQPPIPQKISGDKTNATEHEKQKIFALESQRTEVGKQIQSLGPKTQALDSEKAGIQKEKENWQNKLNPLMQAQQTASSERKEVIEKERWPIEKELEKIENRLKDVDAKYGESQTQKDQLNQKITQIDNSLKEIYSTIDKRTQEAKKAEQVKKEQQPTIPPVAPKAQKQPTEMVKEPEKPYLKNIPPAAKEKLAESLNAEEQQRRKFLEDIDKWASQSNK